MPRTVTIINFLLGIAIIALLAGIATERLSTRLEKAVLPKAGSNAVSPSSIPSRTELSFYAPILTGGLFGKATQGQLAVLMPIFELNQLIK